MKQRTFHTLLSIVASACCRKSGFQEENCAMTNYVFDPKVIEAISRKHLGKPLEQTT